MKVVLSFLALVVAGIVSTGAQASCPTMQQGPPCQEYWRSDAVFIALATHVQRTPNTTGLMVGPYLDSTVYFSVEEAFKGVEGPVVIVELNYCGYSFKQGERYLVYAHRNPNNNKLDIRAGNTRTRPLSEAGDDLEYIRGIPTAEKGSRVFGKVLQYSANIRESNYVTTPLPDIEVTLVGKNQFYKAVTDSEGKYQILGIPAGTYRFRATVTGHSNSYETPITLAGHECFPADIAMRRNGRIVGKVLNVHGQPVPHVPISIVSADASPEEMLTEWKEEKRAWGFGKTNEQGRYKFSSLAPGRYLLIINRGEFEKSRGGDAARSLPRLFYPGVNDAAGASVIMVGENRKTEDYNFTVSLP